MGEKFKAWTLLKDASGSPFAHFDAFCEAPTPHGLGVPSARIRAALEQVHGKAAVRVMTTAPAMTKAEAGARGGKGNKAADNVRSLGGNSSEARIARLKRDFPAIADAYASGELKSVSAAWRAAGLEKPKDAVTVAVKAFLRLDASERRRFHAEIKATK